MLKLIQLWFSLPVWLSPKFLLLVYLAISTWQDILTRNFQVLWDSLPVVWKWDLCFFFSHLNLYNLYKMPLRNTDRENKHRTRRFLKKKQVAHLKINETKHLCSLLLVLFAFLHSRLKFLSKLTKIFASL